jgi:hypothetical protein
MNRMTSPGSILRTTLAFGIVLAILAACDTAVDPPVVDTDHTLSVSVTGGGTGTVTSQPDGIELTTGDSTATADFTTGTQVTLTATPLGDSVFTGWSGACTGTNECVVTMDADRSVTATFAMPTGDGTTVTVSVAQGSDDATEYLEFVNANYPEGSVDLTSTDLDLAFDLATNAAGGPRGATVNGLRFQNVAIPDGATITSASITFTRHSPGAGTVTLTFEGVASDDPGTFVRVVGEGNQDITSRPRTEASEDWVSSSPWGATAMSVDLSSIVQELVDRDGWQSGNAMAFVISSPDSNANNYRRAESFETPGGTPAQLSITYTLP